VLQFGNSAKLFMEQNKTKKEWNSATRAAYRKTKHWKDRCKKTKVLYKTCVLCGTKRTLCVHHVSYDREYDEDNISNLILVCRADHLYLCHRKHNQLIEDAKQQLIKEALEKHND